MIQRLATRDSLTISVYGPADFPRGIKPPDAKERIYGLEMCLGDYKHVADGIEVLLGVKLSRWLHLLIYAVIKDNAKGRRPGFASRQAETPPFVVKSRAEFLESDPCSG